MSLLMDALKKADEAKKKQVVATAGLNTSSASSNENPDSVAAITEAKDSPASNEVSESLIIDAEEELVLIEVTNDDTTLAETTPLPEDKDNFSLITATAEPFLSEFPADTAQAEPKYSWDDEFLPEFQQDLQELANSSTEEAATLDTTPFNEFTAYNDLELVSTQPEELREDFTTTEEIPVQPPNELNQPDPVTPPEPLAVMPSVPLVSSRRQAKNWFLSLPLSNKSKSDTTTAASTQAEVEIEPELVKIEPFIQTEPAVQTTPHSDPDDYQIAQRILAAHSATNSSKRTWWLSGVLGVLLIGMGGSYYYYTQSSLIQPSSLKFGQLNQRLKATALSTPPVAKVTDSSKIPPNPPPALAPSPPNLTGTPQPIMAQTQPGISTKLPEVTHQITAPVEPPQSNIISVPEPINLVKTVENNPPREQPTVSAENLLANKAIRTEIAKLIADEIAKQFAAKLTPTAAEQKSIKATATPSPTPSQSPSAAKTRPPENQSNTSSPTPPPSTTATTEPTQMPTLHKNLTDQLNNELSSAYKNFHQGNERLAYDTYHRILQQDPNNREALLGFAALAVRHGNISLARQYYQQVLQSYPQDPHAQVGLINTLNSQPTGSESQLKLLLEKSPQSAYIYFSLGNLYANQGRWTQAQPAYFNAYHYDSSQADYAYNLAISLDQLNQIGAALNYYQQALRLAQHQEVNFNQPAVQKRVQTLRAYTRPSALDNLSTQLNNN